MTLPDTHSATPTAAPRSTFVTVVAWLFILLSAFGIFITVLQNVVVHAVPDHLFPKVPRDTIVSRALPTAIPVLLSHFKLLLFIGLAASVVSLATAIGLLHRRNWARLVFLGVLGLGIVFNVGMVVLQETMMSSFTSRFPLDSLLRADSTFHLWSTMDSLLRTDSAFHARVTMDSLLGADSTGPFRAGFPRDSLFLRDSILAKMPMVMERMMTGMRVLAVIWALAKSALFAWLMVKFVSPPVRAEFGE